MKTECNYYQYIGVDYTLEDGCVNDMVYEGNIISHDRCKMLLGIDSWDTETLTLMFPRLSDGLIYESSFDGFPCIYFELQLESQGRETSYYKNLRFVWMRID